MLKKNIKFCPYHDLQRQTSGLNLPAIVLFTTCILALTACDQCEDYTLEDASGYQSAYSPSYQSTATDTTDTQKTNAAVQKTDTQSAKQAQTESATSHQQTSTQQKSTTSNREDANDANTASNKKVTTQSDKAEAKETTNKPTVKNTFAMGEALIYDTSDWSNGDNKTIFVHELPIIRANVASIVDIDENSLDYISHPATKYRYTEDNAPYLDLVDSEQYLEFGWYYANPNDTKSEKMTSLSHAKRIFNMARYLMGSEGEILVTQMLNGQVTKDKLVGGVRVELAKCEFYTCMLVINKKLTNPPTQNDSDNGANVALPSVDASGAKVSVDNDHQVAKGVK